MHFNSSGIDIRASIVRLVATGATFAVIGTAVTNSSAAAGATLATAAEVKTVVEARASRAAEVPETVEAEPLFDAKSWNPSADGLNPEVLELALRAAATAVERGDARAPVTLTVIDFSRPSTVERMWVYNLATRALLFKELVSHGRGSGRTDATMFSNEPESHKSSLGLYRTAEPYIGKHGYSLRLDGLEPGVNDRARDRAIVLHGADYVNGAAAKAQGYLGRSLGCPAVRPEVTRELIETVKDGGLVFAYYPDPAWLAASTYLN